MYYTTIGNETIQISDNNFHRLIEVSKRTIGCAFCRIFPGNCTKCPIGQKYLDSCSYINLLYISKIHNGRLRRYGRCFYIARKTWILRNMLSKITHEEVILNENY